MYLKKNTYYYADYQYINYRINLGIVFLYRENESHYSTSHSDSPNHQDLYWSHVLQQSIVNECVIKYNLPNELFTSSYFSDQKAHLTPHTNVSNVSTTGHQLDEITCPWLNNLLQMKDMFIRLGL